LPAQGLPQLRVSDNGHYLQYTDGTPFFYQGDTAWELFHRLTREEADRYLQNRADKATTLFKPWHWPNVTAWTATTPTATSLS